MKTTRVVTLNGQVIPYVVHVDATGGMVTFLRRHTDRWATCLGRGVVRVYPSVKDYELALLETWYALPSPH